MSDLKSKGIIVTQVMIEKNGPLFFCYTPPKMNTRDCNVMERIWPLSLRPRIKVFTPSPVGFGRTSVIFKIS